MIPKLFNWLLGDKIASSLVGITGGAIAGAATVAATGNLTKEGLLIGAAGGVLSGIAGASGRGHGE